MCLFVWGCLGVLNLCGIGALYVFLVEVWVEVPGRDVGGGVWLRCGWRCVAEVWVKLGSTLQDSALHSLAEARRAVLAELGSSRPLPPAVSGRHDQEEIQQAGPSLNHVL